MPSPQCNRFFQGITLRSRTNPEIYEDVHVAVPRGLPERLAAPKEVSEPFIHKVLALGWRDSLETQTTVQRAALGSEDARQRRDGFLEDGADAQPPQHYRDTVTYGFSREPRHLPKLPGELSVVRAVPAARAHLPALRTENEAP